MTYQQAYASLLGTAGGLLALKGVTKAGESLEEREKRIKEEREKREKEKREKEHEKKLSDFGKKISKSTEKSSKALKSFEKELAMDPQKREEFESGFKEFSERLKSGEINKDTLIKGFDDEQNRDIANARAQQVALNKVGHDKERVNGMMEQFNNLSNNVAPQPWHTTIDFNKTEEVDKK